MGTLAQGVLNRLPLADAVLTTWQWLADDTFLDDLFEEHRGRCYEKELSFATLVHLIHDVLVGASNSARERFTAARDRGELEVYIPAAYDKLRRLPIPLSVAFLAGCTRRLRSILPDPQAERLPTCLDGFAVLVIDGKTIKHVAKRLKLTRGFRGGVLGGRALVCQDMRTGLVVGMHADEDGEANDVRFVPDLIPVIRDQITGPILWVEDAAFGFPEVLSTLSSETDRYVARYHGNVKFAPDSQRAARTGTDAQGRAYREEWGWLGGSQNKHRQYTRRITLDIGAKKPLVLVTNVLDADAHPAVDLLEVYRRRWGIENVFQQITEVFGLARLIGSTPEATVFQLSFCVVLYNLMQAIRSYVAVANNRPMSEVSGEKLFRDVKKELISWQTVVTVDETRECFAEVPSRERVQQRLKARLGGLWRAHWVKAKPKKKATPHPNRPYRSGEHKSVARARAQHKVEQMPKQKQIDRLDI